MAANMSVDDMLEIVADNEQEDIFDVDDLLELSADCTEARRRTRHKTSQLRQGMHARHRKLRFRKQEEAKAYYYNSHGHAKTSDYYLKTHKDVAKQKSKKSKTKSERLEFRKYTPEFILKVASSNPLAPVRSHLPNQTAPGASAQCSKTVALAVHSGQKKGLEGICSDSRNEELAFFITNNMADETKLPLGASRTKRSSCLAWHSQVTYKKKAEESIVDDDIIRPPRHIRFYRASVLWNLMASPNDSAGLRPCADALPEAEYIGNLWACDSHSVNLLLSKFICAHLKPNEYHMMSLCMQHRVGSCSEEVSKQWNLIPPCLCLARLSGNGDFHDSLEESVRTVLIKYLHRAVDEDEEVGHDIDLIEFAKLLIEKCYVEQHEVCHGEEKHGAEEKRRQKAQKFLEFFPPPWSGVMTHPCKDGCCADFMDSVKKGTALIMEIIFPKMSEPAANRYTKVYPAVLQVTLALNFFNVAKKAILRIVNGISDDSDVDEVLRDPDALVGAPSDAIVHMRKLQACSQT